MDAVKGCAVPAPVVGGVYASLFGGGVYTSFDMLPGLRKGEDFVSGFLCEDRRRAKFRCPALNTTTHSVDGTTTIVVLLCDNRNER
jgi:hypothetical protein